MPSPTDEQIIEQLTGCADALEELSKEDQEDTKLALERLKETGREVTLEELSKL